MLNSEKPTPNPRLEKVLEAYGKFTNSTLQKLPARKRFPYAVLALVLLTIVCLVWLNASDIVIAIVAITALAVIWVTKPDAKIRK